ncbi:MAG: putative beta-lactamase class penicillin binding protein [Bacteroidetes bacterium]|nr:putative beta-lactamase class penicillin binding protein [Bacteroidota bacterium]
MKRVVVVLFVSIAASMPLRGQTQALASDPEFQSTVQILGTWVKAQMEYAGIPGLAIAIVHDRELVWSAGFGVRDISTKEPVTPQTLFRIASITKTFTSTATLILRDRGRLGLDDPVAKHLPWFTYKNAYPDEPVTIRQLLTHTSGLPREAAFPYWTDYEFPTREQMIEAFQAQESVFEPATRLKYSNLAMSILGEVVAAAAGMPYERFIQQAILDPAGMKSTCVFLTPEFRSRLATGYGRRMPDGSRKQAPLMDARGIAPAANISSTVEDMAMFAAAHMQEERGDSGALLKPATLREMHRVSFVNPGWDGGYGLGFSVTKTSDRLMYGHGGWVAGNRSQLRISPSEKVGVIVMINCDDANPATFADRAMAMVAPVISRITAAPVKEAAPDPAWAEYAGRYTDPDGWVSEVLIRKGKLMMYDFSYPPENNPLGSLVELAPEGPDRFRKSGDGGDGELVIFERNPDRTIKRVKVTENYIYPVK